MSTLTLPELYETLTAGNKFHMRFSCKDEAVAFRNRLATHKFRAEKQLKLLGIIEPQVLSMTYDGDANIAAFFLQERKQQQDLISYEILEITPVTPPISDTTSQ